MVAIFGCVWFIIQEINPMIKVQSILRFFFRRTVKCSAFHSTPFDSVRERKHSFFCFFSLKVMNDKYDFIHVKTRVFLINFLIR